MNRPVSLALGAAGAAVGVLGAWNLYRRYTTESVPYTVVASVGDVELRRYPPTVLAETVADGRREAFGRLFRYIAGANETETDLAMTAPVRVGDGDDGGRGVSIPMTAPVEVSDGSRRIPMTAPVETDDAEGACGWRSTSPPSTTPSRRRARPTRT
ncbi:heme-binding protein [Halobaculum litoreum]|uniref:Heme-binding protein n=1 Tax=Halobaculum litoreum TaxID=3031998 RepID=A0ABD5XS11_9EURY